MVLLAGIVYFAMAISMSAGRLPGWPNQYGAAKWVSESPDIWFEITGEEERVWDGKFVIDGIEYPCKVSVELASIYFWKEDVDMNHTSENDILFEGHFHFLPKKAIPREFIVDPPEKLVFTVLDWCEFFGGEKLEFVRQGKESSETEGRGSDESGILREDR